MKTLFSLAAILLILPFAAAAQSLGKIPIELMSCTELQCIYKTDVFLTGQYAYIDYNTSVKGVTIAATITFPDGSTQQTTFPNRVMSNLSGTYIVQLTAWKDGYNETTVSKFIRYVDNPLPDSNSTGNQTMLDQNPPKVDVIPIIAVIAAAVAAFAVWRYSKRTPHHKKESKRI